MKITIPIILCIAATLTPILAQSDWTVSFGQSKYPLPGGGGLRPIIDNRPPCDKTKCNQWNSCYTSHCGKGGCKGADNTAVSKLCYEAPWPTCKC